MPAGVRGGSLAAAKPRPKATSKLRSAGPRRTARAVEYAPAKLAATRAVNISPAMALSIAALVLLAGMAAALATGGRGQAAAAGIGQALDHQAAGFGFRLSRLTVEGASPMAQADIAAATGLHAGDPLLGVDLDALRRKVEHVGWVREAKVVRLLPDTLVIAVDEHAPQAVWQHGGRLWVVDEAGRPIPEADPARFPSLPLAVGDGANEAIGALLPLLRARPRLMQRLEAVIRFDDRRWDLRLKDGCIIALPALGEDSALIRLDQLDHSQRILDLGFERIDLRQPELIAVRPRPIAAALTTAGPAPRQAAAAAPVPAEAPGAGAPAVQPPAEAEKE